MRNVQSYEMVQPYLLNGGRAKRDISTKLSVRISRLKLKPAFVILVLLSEHVVHVADDPERRVRRLSQASQVYLHMLYETL